MTTFLNCGRDVQGFNVYAPEFADDKTSVDLVGGDEQKVTVPSNYQQWTAVFSLEPGASVWVANNETAELPSGSSFTSTTSEQNPAVRTVFAGDVLSFITSDSSAKVGISFYAVS